MSRFRILSIPVLAVAVLVLLLAGSAAAYFTAEGSGSGGASTTTLEDLTVVGGASTSLHPGGSADLVLVVTNPNPFAVPIVAVTPAGDVRSDAPACVQSAVSLVAPAQSVVDALPVLAADGPTTITLPGAITMGTGSDPGCQGASFEVPVTVEVIR